MIVLFAFFIIFIYPAIINWAWTSGGASRVHSLTIVALTVFIAMSLFAATPWAGNRLVDTEGFWPVAWRILVFYGLVIGLPILTTALVVLGVGARVPRRVLVYVIAASAAFITFIIGTFVAVFAFFS